MTDMIFISWVGLLRVFIVGTAGYIALVFILRISGKRTLAKLNAFDLVVTVAFGSTLSSMLLSKSVALAEGILAFGLLAFLQFIVVWLSTRYPSVGAIVKSEPTLLLHNGEFLRLAMRDERIMEDEVLAAIRSAGLIEKDDVASVVLETDGSLSVVAAAPVSRQAAVLKPVR